MSKQEIHCSHDLPISQCLEHWQEFCEATDITIEERALKWALSGDTGVSSETLCAFMSGVPVQRMPGSPSDASDRGRCIRLLKIIPEWIPRLNELTMLDNKEVSINGADPVPYSETEYSWTYQIPLIIKEGGF